MQTDQNKGFFLFFVNNNHEQLSPSACPSGPTQHVSNFPSVTIQFFLFGNTWGNDHTLRGDIARGRCIGTKKFVMTFIKEVLLCDYVMVKIFRPWHSVRDGHLILFSAKPGICMWCLEKIYGIAVYTVDVIIQRRYKQISSYGQFRELFPRILSYKFWLFSVPSMTKLFCKQWEDITVQIIIFLLFYIPSSNASKMMPWICMKGQNIFSNVEKALWNSVRDKTTIFNLSLMQITYISLNLAHNA